MIFHFLASPAVLRFLLTGNPRGVTRQNFSQNMFNQRVRARISCRKSNSRVSLRVFLPRAGYIGRALGRYSLCGQRYALDPTVRLGGSVVRILRSRLCRTVRGGPIGCVVGGGCVRIRVGGLFPCGSRTRVRGGRSSVVFGGSGLGSLLRGSASRHVPFRGLCWLPASWWLAWCSRP